jgi:RNA polymerase sigma-70 factor (ECF subfamily)
MSDVDRENNLAERQGGGHSSSRNDEPGWHGQGRLKPDPGAPAESDAALVARIAGGDESALGALFDIHGPAAYSLAYAITGEARAAEKAAADAFADFWRKARSFDPERASVAGWLAARVRDYAVAVRRSSGAKRGTGILAAASPGLLSATPTEPERAARARSVASALAGLPATQRRILELAYFGGLTTREIALELNEPVARIGENLRRALDVLRVSLGAHAAIGRGSLVTRV